jgi:hypothetical protein
VQEQADRNAERAAEAVEQGADPVNELAAEQFSNALTAALNKVGLAKLVKVRSETSKVQSKIGKKQPSNVAAWFDPLNQEIVIRMPDALNRPDVTEAEIVDYANQMLNHEVIHAMREADLITEAEWNTLRNFVRNTKLNKELLKNDPLIGNFKGDSLLESVRRRYDSNTLSEEQLLEEAIAEAYRLWNKHGGKFAAGKPQSIFKKILNYIKSFASAFKESGATNAEQIFSAIASGQIGQRTPGLSVFNPSADAAIRSLRRSDIEDTKVRQQVRKEGKPGGVKKFGATKPADSEVSQAISESEPLSERDEAFNKLADMQRGKPEMAMLVVQDTLKKEPYSSTRGNGPLNYLVEHVGDLTHRMAEKYATSPGSEMGIEYVEPKIRSALRILDNRLDFQVLNEFPEMPELARYADEHRKLPVYNEAQRLARDAAVAIGERDFNLAKSNLQKLNDMIKNGTYVEEASKYSPIKEARISDANRKRVNDVVDFQIENTAPGYVPRYNPNAPEAATLAAIEFENDGREREMPQFGLSLAISNINNEDVNNPTIENSLDRHARIKEDNRTWGQKTLDLLDAGLSDFGRKFRKEIVDKYNEFRRQETELIGTDNERNLMAETSVSGMLGTIDRIQGIVAAMIRTAAFAGSRATAW